MIQSDYIKDMLAKAKLLNCLKEISTFCHHKCYLISMSDTQHLVYIPDDVTEPNYNTRHTFTNNIKYLQGSLKIVGGKNLKDANFMFYECQAQSIDLSNLDTSNVTDMKCMFDGCTAQFLDISSFNTSKVTNMLAMFYDCQAQSLDLSRFDTSNVTDMDSMFRNCQAQSLDLSSFNTSKVTSMHAMFHKCQAQSIDLSSFNTSKVTNMEYMFSECQAQIKTTDKTIMEEYNNRQTEAE